MHYKHNIKMIIGIAVCVILLETFPALCMEEGEDCAKEAYGEPQETRQENLQEAQQALLRAIEGGETNQVREIVHQGIDLNFYDHEGRGPMHYAAMAGDTSILAVLADAKGDLRDRDDTGREPLHYAAMAGQLEALMWLIEQGVDRDARAWDGCQPAHYAARHGHVAILEYYTGPGSVVEDHRGREPIHYAARAGRINVLQFLDEHGVSSSTADAGGELPIHYASNGGHFNALVWLSEHGADCKATTRSGNNAFHYVAENGSIRLLAWLLGQGVSPEACNRDGTRPLHRAGAFGNIPALTWLILHGCNRDALDYKKKDAVWHSDRHLKTLLWLFDHGASLTCLTDKQKNGFKPYPLILAILNSQEDEAIALLLKRGVQESAGRDANEWRHAFLLSIALGYRNLFSFMLEHSEGKMTSRLLRAALETAAACGNADACLALYACASSYIDSKEMTYAEVKSILENALEWASVAGHEKAVTFILNYAIAYEGVPDLNVGRALNRLNEIEARAAQLGREFNLESIRDRLILAQMMQDQRLMFDLQDLIDHLPSELRVLVMSFALSPG